MSLYPLPPSEVCQVIERCATKSERARVLLELPYARLLDTDLQLSVGLGGEAAERNYVDVTIAWLLARPERRRALETTWMAVTHRLQRLAEDA